jgi:NAD(P)-dependent dehydrogenase (short-subunit alcohol dehydrogenase family)
MWSGFMSKTVLVTGASAGIGEATVRRFLAEGYTVYAAARRLDRMAPLAAAGAKLLSLDLTDDASIVAAVDKIRGDTGRLDVLINNAGYGSYGAVEDVPMDEARRQFEVNVFGAARLCQLALPMMRAQKSGKIVNVTSIGGKFGMPFGAWYHATKFALEGLSDSLRLETKPFGIDVIVIEPGAIRTEWSGIARESLLARSGETPYGSYARRMAEIFDSAGARRASPPEAVAKIIGNAVAAKRPRIRYAAAGGAPLFLFLARVLPDRAKDAIIERMVQGRSAA